MGTHEAGDCFICRQRCSKFQDLTLVGSEPIRRGWAVHFIVSKKIKRHI